MGRGPEALPVRDRRERPEHDPAEVRVDDLAAGPADVRGAEDPVDVRVDVSAAGEAGPDTTVDGRSAASA